MKNDKNEKTPYIMTTTKHFNDVHIYLWWLCHVPQYWKCSFLLSFPNPRAGENHLAIFPFLLFTLFISDLMCTIWWHLQNIWWLCSELQVAWPPKLAICLTIVSEFFYISGVCNITLLLATLSWVLSLTLLPLLCITHCSIHKLLFIPCRSGFP